MMIHIKINNRSIEAEEGQSILEAAKKTGIEIPAMCHHEGLDHFTSCMVCLVKDAASGKLIPACSVEAVNEMEIITDDDEVSEARKTALELLLSEHVGDCEAPCRIACPAHMDIPLMNRLLQKGSFSEALEVVKKDIALPSVLGRICPAPCESICHRKSVDSPVSICMLKRFAGDHEPGYAPQPVKETGKKVAVIGGGPAGLAAAFHIRSRGNKTTVFEKDERAGGILWDYAENGQLPRNVLEGEIEAIAKTGVEIKTGIKVGESDLNYMVNHFDAVIIACGKNSHHFSELDRTDKGIKADKHSYQTNIEKVFAVGNSIAPARMVIRILAQGKEVAFSVEQFLKGDQPTGEESIFNSRFGKLFPEEFAEYLKESVKYGRIEPEKGSIEGLSSKEVKKEAARCLHCDCRDKDNCKLRIYSHAYKADQKRYKYDTRKVIKKKLNHNLVAYEPGKCIKCGKCVRITGHYKEQFGFTFIGRGFDVEIGVPFNENINDALTKTAMEVADACPTGAISKL